MTYHKLEQAGIARVLDLQSERQRMVDYCSS